jgi:hypothetical protein
MPEWAFELLYAVKFRFTCLPSLRRGPYLFTVLKNVCEVGKVGTDDEKEANLCDASGDEPRTTILVCSTCQL